MRFRLPTLIPYRRLLHWEDDVKDFFSSFGERLKPTQPHPQTFSRRRALLAFSLYFPIATLLVFMTNQKKLLATGLQKGFFAVSFAVPATISILSFLYIKRIVYSRAVYLESCTLRIVLYLISVGISLSHSLMAFHIHINTTLYLSTFGAIPWAFLVETACGLTIPFGMITSCTSASIGIIRLASEAHGPHSRIWWLWIILSLALCIALTLVSWCFKSSFVPVEENPHGNDVDKLYQGSENMKLLASGIDRRYHLQAKHDKSKAALKDYAENLKKLMATQTATLYTVQKAYDQVSKLAQE